MAASAVNTHGALRGRCVLMLVFVCTHMCFKIGTCGPGCVRVPSASRALGRDSNCWHQTANCFSCACCVRGAMVSTPCCRRSTAPRGSHCKPQQQACVSVHCWQPAGGCSEPAGQARVSKAKARGWQRPVIIKWKPGLPCRRVSLSRAPTDSSRLHLATVLRAMHILVDLAGSRCHSRSPC